MLGIINYLQELEYFNYNLCIIQFDKAIMHIYYANFIFSN